MNDESSPKDDLRVFLRMEPVADLRNAQPYALKELVVRLLEDITLADLLSATAIRTGYALTTSSEAAQRSILDHADVLTTAGVCTKVDLPTNWLTYAVSHVPLRGQRISLDSGRARAEDYQITESEVLDEIRRTTQREPTLLHRPTTSPRLQHT
jgi:hypothetical protein